MPPSDFRRGRVTVMHSRRPLIVRHTLPTDHPAGSPRFLTSLSMPAVPFHPEEPDRCVCSLLHGRYQASPPLEGWPLLICLTRPYWVRLRYG